jgi:hypothetical protein
MNAPISKPALDRPRGLWSLWDMVESYFPIYQIALSLQSLRSTALFFKESLNTNPFPDDVQRFNTLLAVVHQRCLEYGLTYTSDMAKRIADKPTPNTYADMFATLDHLNDSLSHELQREAIFCIPPERKDFYERNDLFGSKVSTAFPSCTRDIQKAGSCYALAQEDACVHHLMLVLERGLNALAAKVGASFHYADWQKLIDQIEIKLKSGMPRGPELDFYRHVNAQFGFLKEAYRKHSAHARDDPYDMPKALSIFNHVKEFMQELEKGGLSE